MGHPDGAHTHGDGGWGGTGLLAAFLVLAVSVAGPVAAGLTALLRVVVIAAAVLAAAGMLAIAALVAWRLRHPRPQLPWQARASITQPRPPMRALPPPAAPQVVHLHFHGAGPEQVAEAVRRAGGQR